ncbi:MAG: H-type lectin domain-containing protein, partial [Nanoarchaeota archaeon]|nr:H-type lectin domain-containing protein [Nanoarchaeota archaeon]
MKQKYSTGIVKILILAFLVITMFNTIFAQFQMEWGSQETINETWIQINLSTYFIDPIIVATPQYSSTTANFGIEVQITNITNTSFMIKSSDENFGSLDNITAHYIALERGSWELPGSGIKIEAGSITTNKIGSRSIGWDCPTEGEIINFANAFDSNPLVLATKASNNNPTTWSTTFKHGLASNGDSVSSSQMCIGHSFSKAISPGPFTNQEDLNWIAIDQGDGFLGGVEFEVLWQLQDSGDSGGNWINGYGDPRPFTQSWNHAWIGAPNIILGGITSVAGTDGGWAVIHDTGNTGSIRIFVDEPNERAHAGSESGGGFAFNNASFVEATPSINWTTNSFDIGFGVITNGNISSSTTIETYKNHNNISVSCISGNCSNIISNFTTININHSSSHNIYFTCTNQTTGIFNAQYALESNEDTSQDILNVSCQIFKEFGDINVTLKSPTPSIIRQVAQNQTIEIEVDITCTGDINTSCGNITAYPRYNGSSLNLGDGSDGDVVINTANTIINDYTYLAGNELSGTTTITVNDASSFSLDDSILIIQMQNGSGIGNAGQYEYATITAISGND